MGDDSTCDIPNKIMQVFFSDNIIQQQYIMDEKNKNPSLVTYCKQFLLYRIVQLCIHIMKKEQTIYVHGKKVKRKCRKAYSSFLKEKIQYNEMFHNIISRSLFQLEKRDNFIHSPDYQTLFQSIFNSQSQDIIRSLVFLSTNPTFTLLDIYYIRQCNVWILHIVQEQQKQSQDEYWSKYLYRDLRRVSNKIQRSLI
jgi:hypothetical protein